MRQFLRPARKNAGHRVSTRCILPGPRDLFDGLQAVVSRRTARSAD